MAILLVVFLGCLGWLTFRQTEPIYEGKRLSVWLQNYNTADEVEIQKTDAAVRQIGAKGFPTLFEMLQVTDSPLKLKLLALIRRQNVIQIRHVPSEYINEEALRAFQTLGPQGSNAVPELIRIYDKKISASSRTKAARALAVIGPAASAAVPSLFRGIHDHDFTVCIASMQALGNIRA